MLELDAHNWVTLVSETRTTAVWSINSNLSMIFQKQRDELVLRKQAEFNIIQKKVKVKKKFDGYDEALNRSFKIG
jgi:DNA-binding transcriptional regulator/RsmH inhibitor MraZ